MSGQGELALTGLPKQLVSATPTRLTTWLDCPRRYRFAYLDRPAPRVLALSGRVDRLDDRPCADGSRELHRLPSDEVVGHEHTPESLARHLGRAEELAEETGAADTAYRAGLDDDGLAAAFPASPSTSCRWCDFVRVCPEGSAQYRPAEPWGALDEPAG